MIIHEPNESVKDSKTALRFLKEGNKRYIENNLSKKNTYSHDRDILQNVQKPFAIILCCSDSRVSPEIFFDQKLGDLFVIRNAGNIVDEAVIASIEYAIDHLDTLLVVVCGHTSCGAVGTAILSEKTTDHDNLTKAIQSLIACIEPALEAGASPTKISNNHAQNMSNEILKNNLVQQLNIEVVSASYDIHTGVVSWL